MDTDTDKKDWLPTLPPAITCGGFPDLGKAGPYDKYWPIYWIIWVIVLILANLVGG